MSLQRQKQSAQSFIVHRQKRHNLIFFFDETVSKETNPDLFLSRTRDLFFRSQRISKQFKSDFHFSLSLVFLSYLSFVSALFPQQDSNPRPCKRTTYKIDFTVLLQQHMYSNFIWSIFTQILLSLYIFSLPLHMFLMNQKAFAFYFLFHSLSLSLSLFLHFPWSIFLE